MSVLLMRLSGPMQSWGTQSRFTIRDTNLEPSKSGVIGLLCAAIGKPRRETPNDGHPPLSSLAALRMGVRVDREGVRQVDFHTAGGGTWTGKPYGVVKADASSGDTVLSSRYYLSGAVFLVGLEGDPDFLLRLRSALVNPVWQLSLGRKSFLPDGPIYLPEPTPWNGGLSGGSLDACLTTYPSLLRLESEDEPESVTARGAIRLILETTGSERGEVRMDQPLSFEPRAFGVRYVTTKWLPASEAS